MNNLTEMLCEGLNPQQTTAVMNPANSCTKIVAGAGTGKTKIISKRFTKLCMELSGSGIETPQNRVLVITFTDKAAGEMKGRILAELNSNGVNDSNQDLWISTFHSFCSRILKKHSIEAGLSPSFKLADEKILENIYENILKRLKYDEWEEIPDIVSLCENLGTEKDILSVKSINKLNKIGKIENILSEIFNIIKKIKSLGINAKEFYEKTTVATQNFTAILENTPFKFESKEEYAQAWGEHFKSYTDDYCRFDSSVFDALADYKVILSKNGKRKAIEYGQSQGFPENLPEIQVIEAHLTKITAAIYAVYQNELERLDYVDFDDLINKTIEIFKNNELIKNYYQNYFKHIIIDEFQDTNGAQLELIELLLSGDDANITFVGDRKQSIYGFRHAVMENLEVLHKDVEAKYGKKYASINLSMNYRSTKEVLHAVNFVTQNELELSNERLFAGIEHPYRDCSVFVTVLKDISNAYEHKVAEAKYIADEILKLKEKENAVYKDFAILVKSHSHADLIEKFLKKKNIPAIKKVNTGYFANPIIKNVIGLLRMAKNMTDEVALIRILKIKFSEAQIYKFKNTLDAELLKEIEFGELKKLNFAQKFMMVREKIEKTPICNFCTKLFDTLQEARKSSDTLLQTYYRLMNEIKPYANLSDFALYKTHNDLIIFEKIIADFMQRDDYISVGTFLDYLDKAKEDKSFELPSAGAKEADAVQIITIHSSKGLEFPYVFVTAITSASKVSSGGIMTFDMQYGDKEGFGVVLNNYKEKTSPKTAIYKELWKKPREKNEALRLFYVAVSRAKKYLNVMSFEQYGTIKPAQYIQNLAEYLDADKPIFK